MPMSGDAKGKQNVADHITGVRPADEISLSDDVLDECFVRIISRAVNGTYQEMGYFPGMRTLLTQARQDISVLLEEKQKLYADNTTLSTVVSKQKAQLRSLMTNCENLHEQAKMASILQAEAHRLSLEKDTQARVMQQYAAENFYLHQELERLTNGVWHQQRQLVPPSRAPKRNLAAQTAGPIPQQQQNAAPHTLPNGYQQTGKRPSLSVAVNQGPPAPAGQSTLVRTSPTTHVQGWNPYPPRQTGHPGPSPSTLSPGGTPAFAGGHPGARPMPYATAPHPAGAASRARAVSTPDPVIDLTNERQNDAGQDAPRKRRKIDETLPVSATAPHTPLDMRAVNQEIASLQHEMDGAMQAGIQSRPQSHPAPTQPQSQMQPYRQQYTSQVQPQPQPAQHEPVRATAASHPQHHPTPAQLQPQMQPYQQHIPLQAQAQPQPQPAQPEAVQTTAAQPTYTHAAPPTPVAPQEQDEEEDEEEEEEEPIDMWDSDGQRSIKYCLGAAFEEEDEKIWCTMCKFRSQRFADTAAPEPMQDISEAELIRHCEEQHPMGWAELRKRKEGASSPV